MDAVLIRLLESVARPVALAIANSLWQGAIIAGIVGAVLSLLRGRNASARYVVACVGLLAILTTTVATGVWYVRHPEPDVGSTVIWHRIVQPAETETEELAAVEAAPAGDLDAAGTGSAQTAPLSPRRTLPNIDMALAGPWVFFSWVAGVLLLGVVHLAGWRRARAIARLGTSAVTSEWARRIEKLTERMRLSRPVRALASRRVSVPTVVGWVRPVILIPVASFTELTASQLELVLIHELAHIRRHDVLINYLQATVETLLFYHPATWWLSRRVRIEREHCCDDAAVFATGDGPAFARALSEVENMRERVPMHAMAADGGAFRNRISRLVGASPSGAGSRGSAGLAGVLVVALVLGLFVPTLTAAPVSDTGVTTDTPLASDWNDVTGEWRAEGFGGQIRMHFDLSDWGECSLTFGDESFAESGDDVRRLEREAGTFILEGGSFPRKWRPAVFRPDAAYASEMQRLGYDIEEPEHLLELAIHDITLEFARGIADAGYDVSRSRLVEFNIHDVTPEYVRGMAEAGYDQLTPGRIIEFAIHDIDPEYVARVAAIGYEDLTPSRLVEFAIHDIEAEYIERMAAVGYEDMSPSRIIEFSIHDIEAEYVERMAAIGYEDLTPSRLIEFAIHDIQPEYVEGMAAIGYDGLGPERIIEFAIHDIQPSFVRGLKELGYDDLSPGRIVEFAIHDVSPDFIRSLEKQGITDVPPEKLIEYKILGTHSRHNKKDSRDL